MTRSKADNYKNKKNKKVQSGYWGSIILFYFWGSRVILKLKKESEGNDLIWKNLG